MRQNPLLMTVMGNPGRGGMGLRPKGAKIWCGVCGAWGKYNGPYRRPRVGSVGGKILCRSCYEGWRSGRRSGESWAMNPEPEYQPNPFILVDSRTLKVIRNWKGSMTDRKPWEWARESARRLGRDVFVVAHPYVPQGFKAGVEVSPLFFSGGPFQIVDVDGNSRQGDLSDIHQPNPSIGASLAGGVAGALVTRFLSNPRGPSEPDEHAARELELFINNDEPLYRQRFVPIVKNLMRKRAKGIYNSEKAAKLFLYLADDGARKYYKEFGTEQGGFKFDLATRWAVAKSLRDSFETEAELGNYDKMAFGVSNNPLTSGESSRVLRDAMHDVSHGSAFSPGFTRSERAGQAFAKAKVVYRHGPRRARKAAIKVAGRAQKLAGTTMSNPGPSGRRRTMPIAQFAKMVRAQRDPALWRDFVAKCKAYYKWSHGTWPTKATVETVRKAGMRGLWITFDMGREPEKTYIMPKGTKRKGAWKHPWDSMPQLRGDAEAGMIITKLSKGNRLTDFLHG